MWRWRSFCISMALRRWEVFCKEVVLEVLLEWVGWNGLCQADWKKLGGGGVKQACPSKASKPCMQHVRQGIIKRRETRVARRSNQRS